MHTRTLVPAERMADRFDRAYTLNFTTVACVRGRLSEPQIQLALRCLERRHPLLRARIVRGGAELAFAFGEAREIPLSVEDAGDDQLLERAAATIRHREWDDAGPRAELTWVRQGAEWSSLLLCMHHVVGDGSSGIIAMRDLLRFIAEPDTAVLPVPSPGQDAFFPVSYPASKAAFLEQLTRGGSSPAPALSLSDWSDAALEKRRPRLCRLRLSGADSATIARRARAEGATVHGVLMAAKCLAIAGQTGRSGLQRLAHPVDFRRYLRELDPEGTPIGDAVGYYVSAVTTEHQVSGQENMSELALTISTAVRAAKAQKEPLWAAPIRGPLLVERTRDLSTEAFRALAEQKIFSNTSGMSNLGPLERLGACAQVGPLTIEDFFFVMASSVINQLGVSAVSFDGRIALQFSCVEPMISAQFVRNLAQRTEVLLREYAA